MKTPEIGIAIVAPGGCAPDDAAVARGIARLQAQGATVHNYYDPEHTFQRFGGTDAGRLAQLNAAAADPDVQVVLALRGSYGISRILPDIDFDGMADSGKLFVGYSDFTAFHMGLMAKTGRASFAGPMLCDDFTRDEPEQFTLDQLWSCLAGPTHTVTGTAAGNPQVEVSGKLWGGNLAMLVHLLGTPYFPEIDGGILFLEDVNEHPYRVERMLLQLLHAGVIGRQQAVVLGDFSAYKLSPMDNGYDFDAMLAYVRQRLPVPVLTGLEFGHIRRRVTLPFGGHARLQSDASGFSLQVTDYPTLARPLNSLNSLNAKSTKPGRLLQLDVLRGLAVFGILLVNIWGFAWGTISLRYGTLPAQPPVLDQLVIFGIAALAQFKFYPIFAFLFGAGFALQTRSLQRQLGSWEQAQAVYRRRLRWLLVFGLLHGFLIWSGDVLTSYAVAGMLILPLASARLSRIRNRAWLVAAGFLLFMCLLIPVGQQGGAPDIARDLQGFAERYAIYTQGSVWAVARLRANDFLVSLLYATVMLPHVIVLYLLGILSVRCGWLTQPRRHQRLWRRVCAVGLGLGLPFNLLAAGAVAWQVADPYQTVFDTALFEVGLFAGGPVLAAGYVAALMLAGPFMLRWLGTWLAPVGRMALSNYLLQSLIGTWLLQGPGLGWGASLRPAEMLGLAVLIMAGQVVLSRYWLRYFRQGPMEALWRRLARLP